jgi:hypothetical protein
MGEVITREAIEKLKRIKGNTRGLTFKADADFILLEEKEEGLARLKEKMQELGCPIKYTAIKPMVFYPIGLRGLELLVIKELFDFNREKFREMGAFQTKTSLIVKLFMKFFISPEAIAGQASKIWRKYYTTGDLKVLEMDSKRRYGVLRLENFALHPLHCQLLEGYFANIMKMIVNGPVVCREVKCTFSGDKYHEFELRW